MSVSSFEGSPLPNDLSTKYQKLATEFAKIRAQLGVLKKAVLDEQAHVTELKEIIKTKDQSLRRFEQEIDSLNFRNQQLTKRVTFLQEEIENLQVANKKGKSKNVSESTPDILLLQEDLEMKIKENARLASRLAEERAERDEELLRWNEELRACKEVLRKYEKQTASVAKANETCQCESLKKKLQTTERELKTTKEELAKAERSLKRQFVSLQMQIVNLEPLMQRLQILISRCANCQPNFPVAVLQEHDILLKKLYEALTEENCSRVPNCIDNYICGLNSILVHVHRNELKNILTALVMVFQQILSAFNLCLNEENELEEAVVEVAEAVRTLRGNLKYQHSTLSELWEHEGEESPECFLLLILHELTEASGHLWSILNKKTEMLHVKRFDSKPSRNSVANQKQINGDLKNCCDCKNSKTEYAKKVRELEEKILSMSQSNSISLSSKSSPSGDMSTGQVINLSNEMGSGNLLNEVPFDLSHLKSVLMNKISEAIADRQFAESRVTQLVTENNSLRIRLEEKEEHNRSLVKQESRLQEQLIDTTRNYEDQLNSMSEHVASMNEKFVQQSEEIEQLNYLLADINSVKGRPK